MKNHFFTSYEGNKRSECPSIHTFIKDQLDEDTNIYDKFDTIVEPFCGSAAFSFYMAQQYPNKFKYIINDKNPVVYELYIAALDTDKLKEVEEGVTKLLLKFNEAKTENDKKEVFKEIKKDKTLPAFIFRNKIHGARQGMFPINKKIPEYIPLETCPIVNFIRTEDITITNEDGADCYDKYKDNEMALIFLDPPYMDSNVDFYGGTRGRHIYSHVHQDKMETKPSLIIFCLELNWLTEIIYASYKQHIYDKKYSYGNRKSKHMLIINKKIEA